MYKLSQRSWAGLERREVHYALNCVSLGCPNLEPTAFSSQNVESLLVFVARDYAKHRRGKRFEGKDEMALSKTYDWYGIDFGVDETELLQHLMFFTQPGTKKRFADFSADIDYECDRELTGFPKKGS